MVSWIYRKDDYFEFAMLELIFATVLYAGRLGPRGAEKRRFVLEGRKKSRVVRQPPNRLADTRGVARTAPNFYTLQFSLYKRRDIM